MTSISTHCDATINIYQRDQTFSTNNYSETITKLAIAAIFISVMDIVKSEIKISRFFIKGQGIDTLDGRNFLVSSQTYRFFRRHLPKCQVSLSMGL